MNELTNEDVLHIAHLARIEVSGNEIEKYKIELSEIMNEIDRINEVSIDDDVDIMISPATSHNVYRNDTPVLEPVDITLNAPSTSGKYFSVKRFSND